MKMDDQSQKMIDRLKADDRRWPVVRWFYVLIGGGLLAVGGRLFIQTVRCIGEDPSFGVAVSTLSMPLIPLALYFGAILLREALHKWSGDPVRRLLLKLIDDQTEQMKDASQQSAAPLPSAPRTGPSEGAR